ncbi:MAG: PKD domain-containing protein, partial [Acidobacteria bacterium]
MRRAFLVSLVVVAALSAASCTVKKTEPPPLAGPSVFALSLAVSATPDQLAQDGASQSQITVLARNENGEPVANLPLRVDLTVGGAIVDFGALTAKNLVTGGDGRATAAYTAPPAPMESVDEFTIITLFVTPVGDNFANASARSVDIRLVPPGVILPPNGSPVAAFNFSPTTPGAYSDVFFDASSSMDDGSIVSYSWNFGDGGTASGRTATHRFQHAGQFVVTLTVVDDRGLADSETKNVSVSASALPTASFVFSPRQPSVNQEILFNAAESKAATGRFIAGYDWNFGSGSPRSGMTVTKAYEVAGTYTVTLTVTDDVGQKATTSNTVSVSTTGAGVPVASFTYSPTSPTTATEITFDASESTSPAGITVYEWQWGDGTHGSERQPARHRYEKPGAYVVRLTVPDAAGPTATVTRTLAVASPP